MDNRVVIAVSIVLLVVLVCHHNGDTFVDNPSNIRVYVINLDRSRDRLSHFKQAIQFSDLPADFVRVSAVDAKRLDISKFISQEARSEIIASEKNGYRKKHYELTRGAVGCFLSHIKVWKLIADSDDHYGIVFEDDASLHPQTNKKLIKNMKHIPGDWDIILLGYFCIKCVNRGKFIQAKKFHGLHGYMIKRSVAQFLLDRSDLLPFRQQIDSYLSSLIDKDLLKIYCTYDTLVTQNNMFATSIQTLPQKTVDKDGDPFHIVS
jgi:GR25 family glycosyltransferase involved in LPS biosynthesis